MTIVLVCGGRNYDDMPKVTKILDAAVERLGLTEVIHGAATGADTLADTWAKSRGVPVRKFPADWDAIDRPGAVVRTNSRGKKYDAAAGGVRNKRMLDEGRPGVVIAFPGEKGTADMIKQAKEAGVRVVEVKP